MACRPADGRLGVSVAVPATRTGVIAAHAPCRTFRQDIAGFIGGEYTISDRYTGELLAEPGWKLMAMIKAATERVWDQETTVPEMPPGDAGGDGV